MTIQLICGFQPVQVNVHISTDCIHPWSLTNSLQAYLVYSHSSPSPLCLCGSWKSTRVWSCRPGCDSDCALLPPSPGSAPWSRPPRSTSCTAHRTRWRLSLRGRSAPCRGSGRTRWTAGWMTGRCWSHTTGCPQPKARRSKRERANPCWLCGRRRPRSSPAEEVFRQPHRSAAGREWEARNGKRCGSMELQEGRQPPCKYRIYNMIWYIMCHSLFRRDIVKLQILLILNMKGAGNSLVSVVIISCRLHHSILIHSGLFISEDSLSATMMTWMVFLKS